MKMEDFITKAGSLKGRIGIELETMPRGIAGQCVEDAMVPEFNVTVILEDKYKEIDALTDQCGRLITVYEQVSDIVSDHAGLKAGEKSRIVDQMEKNKQQCNAMREEMGGLIIKIKAFKEKEDEYSCTHAKLQDKGREINERNRSGYNYIPFYGIAYYVETKNMYNDYEREMSQNEVLRNWLIDNEGEYKRNLCRQNDLERQIEKTEEELKELHKKFGVVIEVLDILSSMIASLGDFITAAGKTKNALKYSLYEDASEAQTAIDQAVGMIADYYARFRKKLDGISEKLGKTAYNEIITLIES